MSNFNLALSNGSKPHSQAEFFRGRDYLLPRLMALTSDKPKITIIQKTASGKYCLNTQSCEPLSQPILYNEKQINTHKEYFVTIASPNQNDNRTVLLHKDC